METLIKSGALHSDFMFVNTEAYKSKKSNVSHIKLSKYGHINAFLTINDLCMYLFIYTKFI